MVESIALGIVFNGVRRCFPAAPSTSKTLTRLGRSNRLGMDHDHETLFANGSRVYQISTPQRLQSLADCFASPPHAAVRLNQPCHDRIWILPCPRRGSKSERPAETCLRSREIEDMCSMYSALPPPHVHPVPTPPSLSTSTTSSPWRPEY